MHSARSLPSAAGKTPLAPAIWVRPSDTWCEQFIPPCAAQVRQRGEILLDIDSTDDPTYGQPQLSFFNGSYGQHMYHPLLIFERHTAACWRRACARETPPVMHAPCPCCCAWYRRVYSPLSPMYPSSCAEALASLCPCSMSSMSS